MKKLTLTGLSGSAISAKTWFDYYKELLSRKPQSIDKEFDKHVTELIEAHDASGILCQINVIEGDPELEKLNSEVTEEEVKINIKKAKNGKTHGVDGILNEAIKAAESANLKILVRLYNILFNYSIFPTSWCVSIIVSIFKSGPKSVPGNYRGISLLSNLSKVFTGILNCRIVCWSEAKNIIAECQAGFRQGRSTIDQIFILKTIVDKYLFHKKGCFYCMFVDFSKAFDTVNRDYLIYTLIKQGMHGKMIKLVREIYSKVQATVQTKDGLTKLFDCILGVRQGCMLSPRLFIIFINELELMLREIRIQRNFDGKCDRNISIDVCRRYCDIRRYCTGVAKEN